MFSQQHLDFITRIYDLPLNPDSWMPVLDEFAPIMNASASAVIAHDPIYAEHQINVVSSYYFQKNVPEKLAEFEEIFGNAEREGLAKMAMDPQWRFISNLEGISAQTEEGHPQLAATEWLVENYNLRHRAASCMSLHRVWADIIAVQYDAERGPITDEEREIGKIFLPHFAKSVELGRAFGVLKSRFNGVLTALDKFHIGIFLLSPNGTVVVRNKEADRLADAADGLTISRDGRLQPTQDGDHRDTLKNAITKAIETVEAQGDSAETLLSLPRRSGDDPYLVEVAPIRDREETGGRFHGCLVFVIDPSNTDHITTDGMQALYNLTGAESEVCKLLAQGLETDEIADTRNLSLGTTRQYIKQALQKTGASNRAQLVRLALTVNLPIDKPDEGT